MNVSEFLELYGKENTKAVYRAGLKRFFTYIYGENEDLDKLAERYLSEDRNHFQDLLRFAASLSGRPITARSYFSCVKEWLAMNDITFTERQLKMVRNELPKGNARTVKDEIDPAKLRKILQHLDVKGRALVLVLASSGMKIGEALKITIDDLKLDREPPEITIRGEYAKTGEQRYAFISREAKEALIEWLKVREDYLRQAKNKNKGLIKKGKSKAKNINDDRVFPFTDEVANQMFVKALRKAGLLRIDKITGRKKLHIHMLRKFFKSQLAQKVPLDAVEELMGHSGYLTKAYRRYTKRQLIEFYKQGEDLLTINMPDDIREIRNEFREKMEKQRELIEYLILENKKLREELNKLKEEVKPILEMEPTPESLAKAYAFIKKWIDMHQKYLASLPKEELEKYTKIQSNDDFQGH